LIFQINTLVARRAPHQAAITVRTSRRLYPVSVGVGIGVFYPKLDVFGQ